MPVIRDVSIVISIRSIHMRTNSTCEPQDGKASIDDISIQMANTHSTKLPVDQKKVAKTGPTWQWLRILAAIWLISIQVTGCGRSKENNQAVAFIKEFNTKCQTMRNHLYYLKSSMTTTGTTVVDDKFWDAVVELEVVWKARHSFTNTTLRDNTVSALAICDELYMDIQRVKRGEDIPGGGIKISSGDIEVTDALGNKSIARAVNTTKNWRGMITNLNNIAHELRSKGG